MAHQPWSAPVEPQSFTDGTAYASSTTLTDVSPGAAVVGQATTLPGLYVEKGTFFRIQAAWTASNTSTPTLLAGFYYGGVAGTALAATSAITTTTAMTNWQWYMDYQGVIQEIGASTGKIMGRGTIHVPTSLTAWTIRPIPETAMAQVTVDTSVAKIITLGLQWGTSSASNTATCRFFQVESLG